MTIEPTIHSAFANAAVERVRSLEIEPLPLLSGVGLSLEEIKNPETRTSHRKLTAFYDLAALASGDHCFGLHLGASIDPRDTGILGYALTNAPTLASMIDYLQRYLRLYLDSASVSLLVEDDRATLNYKSENDAIQLLRQETDVSLGFGLNVLRTITGSHWQPSDVHFQYLKPSDISEYEKVFGPNLHFGQAENAFMFPSQDLRLENSSADPRLLRILDQHMSYVLRQQPEHGCLTYNVREQILHALPQGEPRIADVASTLGISIRSLQRRLKERSKTFSQLLDGVRRDMAMKCLKESDLPLLEVAFLLGYSDFSAFHHAFRRWTGMTPSEYRRRN